MQKLKPYPTYKDSGVEWLGEVPEHWSFRRGKTLFRKMQRPTSDDHEVVTCFRDGMVTLRKNRRVSGFTEALKELGYQGILRGDLVIHAMDAFAGAIGVSDSDGKGSPVYSVCMPQEGSNSKYYAYLIREMARSQWILALAKGIRERSTDFRFEAFGSQLLPLPEFPEQSAIVRYLDYMDRRIQRYIRAKQKLIKLLEEQKQAIIHQAVTGRIDVRTGKPYPAYKPSGVEWLADVPEHWEVRRLKHCLHAPLAYGVLKPDKFEGELSVPIIRILDVSDGIIHEEKLEHISQQQDAEYSRTRVTRGDVVVSVVGTIGRSAVIPDHLGPANLSRALCRVQLNHLLMPDYFHVFCQSSVFLEQANSIPAGTAQLVLNLSDLRSFIIALPPKHEQTEILEGITSRTTAVSMALSMTGRQLGALRAYRTRLISDVVTGKLDVREAASNLPEELEEELCDEAEDDQGDSEINEEPIRDGEEDALD